VSVCRTSVKLSKKLWLLLIGQDYATDAVKVPAVCTDNCLRYLGTFLDIKDALTPPYSLIPPSASAASHAQEQSSFCCAFLSTKAPNSPFYWTLFLKDL